MTTEYPNTNEYQSWINSMIGGWAKRWSWLLTVAALFGALLFINHSNVGIIILAPFILSIIMVVHCLSREILNLRKRVEDLEKKTNS